MEITLDNCMALLEGGLYKEDTIFSAGNYNVVDMDSRTADEIMRRMWLRPSTWASYTDEYLENGAGMLIYNRMNNEYVASIVSDNGDISKHIHKNYRTARELDKLIQKCEDRLNKKVKFSRKVASKRRADKAAATASLIAVAGTAALVAANNNNNSRTRTNNTWDY